LRAEIRIPAPEDVLRFSGKSCTVVTAHGCKDDRDSICSACVQPGAALRTKESIRLSLEKL
jgi:hypothetical protein